MMNYEKVTYPPTKKSGWKYPYNGDDWPLKDNWYWVWACKPDISPDSLFIIPTIAWWHGKEQRFFALGERIVYAWHKAVCIEAAGR